MLSPISWLKEFVNLPPLPKLVKQLNETGTTVAGVREYGGQLEKIIVGEIQLVEPHPNADKLQVATVKVPGKVLSIVCGAKNIEAGQKVPVAQVGTSVPVGPDGVPLKIGRIKIRDVESQGMLCSGYELGLGSDHAGILILDPKIKIGASLSAALKLPETVLETEVTTNRGDELSIYGLAREISAVTGSKLKPLLTKKPAKSGHVNLTVKIDDPNLCRRYSAIVLENLNPGPSPDFIKMRLLESGMRPISNVVDITNYVMLLTGQPQHAFDYSRVTGGQIVVRESKAGERVTTLDGVTRILGFGSIVIADTEKVLGLGGVMGGENSAVTDLTDTIVLESAVFNPVPIRQTSTKLNLRSEASLRFERSVDTEGSVKALELAVDLFQKYAGATVASEVVDIYPQPYRPTEVILTSVKLNQYLGYRLSLTKAAAILSKLGFKIIYRSSQKLSVFAPSWRAHDISIEEDLIEEVARTRGYDQILPVTPAGAIKTSPPSPLLKALHLTKNHLASIGLSEVQTYVMVGENETSSDESLKIANSISKEWEYLRTSLIPSLAKVSAANINLGSPPKIFEIGKIYQAKEGDLPYEKYELGLVGESFAEVRGYFDSVINRLGLKEASYGSCNSEYFADGSASQVSLGSEVVGQIGALSPARKTIAGLRRTLYVGEFDFETLVTQLPKAKTFQPVPRYPSVSEDLSILLALETPVSRVLSTVSLAGAKDLISVEPLDIFADNILGANKKSVTLALTFQSKEKTLTDSEVKIEREKIEKILKVKLGAKIR